jgi:serine/threonine protein kinase
MIGKIVSHYKILENLGEGGMGVVYKAEDIKLERIVALKFLPPHLSNQEEKKRFIHEAKAASALEHSNICTIHEIDETNDGQLFIVMSYLEGKTLRKMIDVSPLKVEEAISISIQIAEGLKQAHEKGIVHRDIKPANIMITTDGTVKIMDFGLAKLGGKTKLTQMGTTLGTFSYMSPEQSRGEDVDRRTDIWSLGVVLYEMLTGQLPFKGDYEQAVVYSIVNEEPEPVTSLRSGIPMELERIVNKALAKNPDERYQHIDDLLADLRTERKNLEYARTGYIKVQTNGQQNFKANAIQKRNHLKFIIPTIVAVVLAIIFFVFNPLKLGDRAVLEVNPNMNFQMLRTPFVQVSQPGLSSDGNWVAFPANDGKAFGLYFMNISGGEPRKITKDSLAFPISADISPDGSQIVYDNLNLESHQIEIRIVSSLGSLNRLLVEVGSCARWRNDGHRIGYIRGGIQFPSDSRKLEFWTVRPDGNDNRLEFIDTVSAYTWQSSFSWSPNGEAIAWTRIMPSGDHIIIIHELAGGRERQLLLDRTDINDVSWTDDDEIIFSTSTPGSANLWMVPAAGGNAIQITRGSERDEGARVSMDGKKLVYLQKRFVGHIWITNSNFTNNYQVTFDDRLINNAVLSPDGKKIAYSLQEYDSHNELGSHIYVMNRNGTERVQLTSGQEFADTPAWSPDGKWIAYCDHLAPPDSSRVFLVDASNPGPRKLMAIGTHPCWLLPDQFLVFQGKNTWRISLKQNTPEQFFQDSTWAYPILNEKAILFYDFHAGMDGWWVVRNLSPGVNAYSGRKKICSTEYEILLEPRGKFLIYVNSQRRIVKVYLPDGREEPILFKPEQLRRDRVLPSFNQGIGVSTTTSLSYDSREFIYTNKLLIGKLILIENPFIRD